MESRDVVVIGGSAGSFGPLRGLIAALPPGLPASVLATVHVGEHARSQLARHLASHADLSDDAAGQQNRTADRAARLAESVRAQVQDDRPLGDGDGD